MPAGQRFGPPVTRVNWVRGQAVPSGTQIGSEEAVVQLIHPLVPQFADLNTAFVVASGKKEICQQQQQPRESRRSEETIRVPGNADPVVTPRRDFKASNRGNTDARGIR